MGALTALSHAATGAAKAAMDFFDAMPVDYVAPGATAQASTPVDPAAPSAPPAKKQRKQKDPNAPKKPLTIYFLWQQSERPLVKQALGEHATNQEVLEELKRRWERLSNGKRQVGQAVLPLY